MFSQHSVLGKTPAFLWIQWILWYLIRPLKGKYVTTGWINIRRGTHTNLQTVAWWCLLPSRRRLCSISRTTCCPVLPTRRAVPRSPATSTCRACMRQGVWTVIAKAWWFSPPMGPWPIASPTPSTNCQKSTGFRWNGFPMTRRWTGCAAACCWEGYPRGPPRYVSYHAYRSSRTGPYRSGCAWPCPPPGWRSYCRRGWTGRSDAWRLLWAIRHCGWCESRLVRLGSAIYQWVPGGRWLSKRRLTSDDGASRRRQAALTPAGRGSDEAGKDDWVMRLVLLQDFMNSLPMGTFGSYLRSTT